MIELSEIYNNSINFLDDNDILMYLCNGGEIKGFSDGDGNINEDDKRTFLKKAYMQYVDSVNTYNSQNYSKKPVLPIEKWIYKATKATHIYSSRIHVGTTFDKSSVKHRVYINSDAKDKWKIADLFREKCEAKKYRIILNCLMIIKKIIWLYILTQNILLNILMLYRSLNKNILR